MAPAQIGVLALQGDFEAHARAVEAAGGSARQVRRPGALRDLRGLILPGGESTTLLRLIEEYGFREAITDFAASGRPLFGTCAGLILLARDVRNPSQPSLGLLDLVVERNGYGRQIDSFVGEGLVRMNGESPEPIEMVMIRAPRIVSVGEGIEILGTIGDEPTLVRQGVVWGATFHPELSSPPSLHRRFLKAAGG